jgi:hypothetical protein
MPTMVGATMSSMRRKRSVKQAPIKDSWQGQLATTVGPAGTAKEKERVFGPLFLFGSSREPDEDGSDIIARVSTRKRFCECRQYFRLPV